MRALLKRMPAILYQEMLRFAVGIASSIMLFTMFKAFYEKTQRRQNRPVEKGASEAGRGYNLGFFLA